MKSDRILGYSNSENGKELKEQVQQQYIVLSRRRMVMLTFLFTIAQLFTLTRAYTTHAGSRMSRKVRISPSGLSVSASLMQRQQGWFDATKLMSTSSRELRFFQSKDLHYATTATNNIALRNTPLVAKTTVAAAAATAVLEPVLSASTKSSVTRSTPFSDDKEKMPSIGKRDITASTPLAENSRPPKRCHGLYLPLSKEERELFILLRKVREETHLSTTLRVAGGWVRDKLLATPQFRDIAATPAGTRLTSKFHKPSSSSMGRQGNKIIMNYENNNCPVDIDIALDDMVGREFADHLNEYLSDHGKDTVSVGVVLKNPEKSKHLETATMKVASFWIDFVNLRAEEYTEDSRIPDLMRIGTPAEDAFRRDLTINALFFNINTGLIEDWTGRGFDDLRRGIVATPLQPLTTLLDDPLRVLRSIRFAARLRFNMDEKLVEAAKDVRVHTALAQKVSRERVGGEVDLMLRSPDPVGAMRLLINLKLVDTVFPLKNCLSKEASVAVDVAVFTEGLTLLSTTHDHLCDCKISPPLWCSSRRSYTTHGVDEMMLMEDEEGRRLLWYAAFLKPIHDHSTRIMQYRPTKRQGKKANRSVISKLLVDQLKRPTRDCEAVEKIMRAANDFTSLIDGGSYLSAMMILLSEVRVSYEMTTSAGDEEFCNGRLLSFMGNRVVDSAMEEDPVWQHAMEFRLMLAKVIKRIGPMWRAGLILSLSERLANLENQLDYAIEGDVVDENQQERRNGLIEQYDAFGTAIQQVGLIGIWEEKPIMDGLEVKKVLPRIPRGPVFRDIMEEQENWMIVHPCGSKEHLTNHLKETFSEFTAENEE